MKRVQIIHTTHLMGKTPSCSDLSNTHIQAN